MSSGSKVPLLMGFLLVLILAAQIAQLQQSVDPDTEAPDVDRTALRNDIKSLAQALEQANARLDRIEAHAARAAEHLEDLTARARAQHLRPAGNAGQPDSGVESGEAAAVAAGAATAGLGEAGAAGGIPEVLEKLAAMEKKLERHGNKGDQWKPTTEELTRELAMTPDQESTVVRAANAAKDQLMELARIPRADGGLFLDDIGDAYRESLANPAGGQARFGALLMRLMAEKVPGRETTYFSELMTISAETHRTFQTSLSPQQYADLQGRNVDVFGIKTGYDPIGDYVAARWGRAK